MLYTGKGDQGTSKLFSTEKGVRLTKSALVFEALGTLDELNSFLGLARACSLETMFSTKDGKLFSDIVFDLQQDIFILQAEVGGAGMTILKDKVEKLESITNTIETELPEIKTFFVPGASELSARFDVCRTVARRVERLLVAYQEETKGIGEESLRYANRLSSVLYALARLANVRTGAEEASPTYK